MRRYPAIWRYGRTLEPNREIEFGLRIEGWFEVDLIDAATGLIKQHLRFKNLITDAGLNNVWGGASVSIVQVTDYCAVGTDSTAPAAGDTALGAEIAPASTNRTNANGGIADVDTYVGASDYWKKVKTYLFTETQGNGNLTELGIFSEVTGGVLWSRQLFKDGVGTPTTVVKTAAEQLRITYEMRVYHPAADASGTFDISGVTYDYTVRPNDVDNALSWGAILSLFSGTNVFAATVGGNGNTRVQETNTLVAETTDLHNSGSSDGPSSQTLSSYVNGNFYREITAVWEPSVGNYASGIGSLVAMFSGGLNVPRLFGMVLPTTKIPKTNVKRLTLVLRGSLLRYP